MTTMQTIRVVLPDAGPLISLARASALDLLLTFRNGIRLVLTDVVEFEVTQRSDDFPDSALIKQFINENRDRIEVLPTTVGSLALNDIKKKLQGGQSASLPKDLSELSVTSFIISMRTANLVEPTLVILGDDWFESNAYAVPGNVHLLSTSAWLDGLEETKVIASAAELRAKIQATRQNFCSS